MKARFVGTISNCERALRGLIPSGSAGPGACSAFFVFIAACLVTPLNAAAGDAFYINRGVINSVLGLGANGQVDATNFVNYGTINIATVLDPYSTADTLNFSNLVSFPGSGVMIGAPGWVFDTEPANLGVARPAANFFNDNLGYIEARDVINPGAVSLLSRSMLFVTATNIVSHGALVVGASGWLRLHGANVDLSRSVAAVTPVAAEGNGSYNDIPTTNNFQPDVAVYDLYAGQTNYVPNFNSASLWTTTVIAGATNYLATAPPGGPNMWQGPGVGFQILNPVADSYTNADGIYGVVATNYYGSNIVINLASNVYKQAVFVGSGSGNVSLGFTPSTERTNRFQTISVLLNMPVQGPVPFLSQSAQVYVQDELASLSTARGLSTNNLTGNTFRPENYLVSRINQGVGGPGNAGYPEPNFFLDSGIAFWDGNSTNIGFDGLTNVLVQAQVSGPYASYGAFFDSLASQTLGTPSGTVSNLPGRVDISADNLDLSDAIIRGEGNVIVHTPHLISSSHAVIDCPNLSLNLGSSNETLTVKSLVGGSVTRFEGSIYAWSGLWSNSVTVVITNNWSFTNTYTTNIDISTNGDGTTATNTTVVTNSSPLMEMDLTNTIAVNYHTLMLDAFNIGAAQLPVTVFDFNANNPNLVLDDPMTVVQSFYMDAESLTLNTNLTLGSYTLANTFGAANTVSIPNWTGTNAPNLLYFTNNGTLSLTAEPGEAHFGDDRASPYVDFINHGAINASSINIDSAYVENRGSLSAPGPIFVQTDAGDFQNGNTTIGGVGEFSGGSLKFNNYQLTAAGQVYFNLTNALFDAGGGSSNSFQFQDGFYLLTKPPYGDLLGTTFRETAPSLLTSFAQVNNVWAGEDRGDSPAGYLNNEALGRLVLTAVSTNQTFVFSGANPAGGDALYVDELDLSRLPDYTNQLQISPNFTIYFAKANLAFTPATDTNGTPQEPEEFLDGQFGGRLRWVPCFAGPNSSQAAVINTSNGLQSIEVNTALLNSQRIDSDGDGVPNAFDPWPFNVGANPSVLPALPPVLPCGQLAQASGNSLSVTNGADLASAVAALKSQQSPPALNISSPAPGQTVLAPMATVRGIASSSSGQTWVYYNVNGGQWTPAASADNGAIWSGSVTLRPGANAIQAYATDSSGGHSPVQSLVITNAPGALLNIGTTGQGVVGPFTNGQWLALNGFYTLTNSPAGGFKFESWSGDYNSTSALLPVYMDANKSVVANFVQSYTAGAGTYSGLFYQSNRDVTFGQSGAITLTTTRMGRYSGSLQIGNRRYPLSGKLSASGAVAFTNRLGMAINLQMDTADNSRLSGTVSGNGQWVASIEALRATNHFAVGKYTFVIPGSGDASDTTEPYGNSYGAITVAPSGRVMVQGLLADGTRFAAGSFISQDGRCALYAPLYRGGGQMLGWLTFSTNGTAGLSGWINWLKSVNVRGFLYYPGKFELDSTNVIGSAYNWKLKPVTTVTNAILVLSGGNLAADLTNNIVIQPNNRVMGGKNFGLTFMVGQGLFRGRVLNPNPANPRQRFLTFGGAILQDQPAGLGYFLGAGTNVSGTVFLGPAQ